MCIINKNENSRVNTILRTEYLIEDGKITDSSVIKDKFVTKDGRVFDVMISYKRRK